MHMEADRQNQSRIKQQTKCEVLGKTNKKKEIQGGRTWGNKRHNSTRQMTQRSQIESGLSTALQRQIMSRRSYPINKRLLKIEKVENGRVNKNTIHRKRHFGAFHTAVTIDFKERMEVGALPKAPVYQKHVAGRVSSSSERLSNQQNNVLL